MIVIFGKIGTHPNMVNLQLVGFRAYVLMNNKKPATLRMSEALRVNRLNELKALQRMGPLQNIEFAGYKIRHFIKKRRTEAFHAEFKSHSCSSVNTI